MKIKKGDNVILLAGKDRGKQGKVLRSLIGDGKVVVDGLNLQKRRQKPRKQNEKGQTVEAPAPVHTSNVSLYCDKCKRGVRYGISEKAGKKIRVCKKCSKEL